MGTPGAWLARRGTLVLVVAIGLLLPALAVLQYRWTGELTQLEQLRARNNLSAAAQQFSTQFDAMLAGIYAEFHDRFAGEGSDDVHAPLPVLPGGVKHEALARQVLVVDRLTDGTLAVHEMGAGGDAERSVAVPPWLDARALQRTLLDEVPALVVRRSGPVPNRWIVVVLDMDRITTDLLPALIAGCVEGGIPVAYDVLINRDDEPARVLYASRAGLSATDFDSWITMAPLFAVHGRDLSPVTARGLMPDAAAHRWRFFIKGQEGALEAAVGAARLRNLGIGAGVLALLALSIGLLVASVRREQRGVRDQLELVARMSHELRTPLATITCAGENLADAVVDSPVEARQYGRIIQQEGRRLNKTIADILLCCRLQIRADAALNLAPTDVGGVIDQAVADSLMVASADAAPVERAIEPCLPQVMADGEALRVAIKNLVVNAIRHGKGGPVRVSACASRADGAEIVVDVEDEGPGIPEDELPRVFDSFFRGRMARDGQVEGSGIGLSVVYHVARAHGGQVRASRVQPHGTRFTLVLPALGRPAARRSGSAA
ncbi:MAG: HAMP domain-containing histidine kinase [Acidobacteria bacterium]|nr:HAMP domain-containing histidine kinase [Acidobacteriota bacterium]